MNIATAQLANATEDSVDRGMIYANAGALWMAVNCFVYAHLEGDDRAIHCLRALRPFCDDLQFCDVARDIISR